MRLTLEASNVKLLKGKMKTENEDDYGKENCSRDRQ